jgi:glutamate synthase (NADPH/NADH) small chain
VAKPTGFMEIRRRETWPRRPVAQRVRDWKEIHLPLPEEKLRAQASRCMDCGLPFCHQGCPLGNVIPEWNELVYLGRWREALDRLHLTNNFPEFTGRLCPAPCEPACVLAINEPAVTIKNIELAIVERGWQQGWIKPEPALSPTGKKVAIVGSGPAGLACAQQLARVGHAVSVFERADRIGGLLRYGVPEFKFEKRFLDRRLAQLGAEGVKFVANAHVGVNVAADELRRGFHALVLCGGASQPRDLNVPGRQLNGVLFAVDYLTQANRAALGEAVPNQVTAKDKHVVILGGGDTGADCLGAAVRQGAGSIRQFELLPAPPEQRPSSNPWPEWPRVRASSPAHEECECREFSVETIALGGQDGRLTTLRARRLEWVGGRNGSAPKPRPVPGSEFEAPCDLLLLAMGFVGAEKSGLVEKLGVELTERGNVRTDAHKMTGVQGVFCAGDMARGQSLVVWAIAEGRAAARGVDLFLMGETSLPTPL